MLGTKLFTGFGAFALVVLVGCGSHKSTQEGGLNGDAGPETAGSGDGKTQSQAGRASSSTARAGAGGRAAGGRGGSTASARAGRGAGAGGEAGTGESQGSAGTEATSEAGSGSPAAGSGGSTPTAGTGTAGHSAGRGGAGAGGHTGTAGTTAGHGPTSGTTGGAGTQATAGTTAGTGGMAGSEQGGAGAGGTGVDVPDATPLGQVTSEEQAKTVCDKVGAGISALDWQGAARGVCSVRGLMSVATGGNCDTVRDACLQEQGSDDPCNLASLPACPALTVGDYVACETASIMSYVAYNAAIDCTKDLTMLHGAPVPEVCSALASVCPVLAQ